MDGPGRRRAADQHRCAPGAPLESAQCRYEVMAEPGNDRSKRLAREAERRVIDARARGAGWQKVLGALLVSGDALTVDDPYVVGSWREAQNLAAELACLGGLAPGGVELLSGLGFVDCGEYVRAGFRRA